MRQSNMTKTIKLIGILLMAATNVAVAADTVLLKSETGDNLMLHKLNSDQLWATFQITDQVLESFALQELIVLQVDQNKPVKLQQSKKVCGAPAPKNKQTLAYAFEPASSVTGEWAFSEAHTAPQRVLKVFGWDDKTYDILPSDRRSEFVDFPLEPIISGSPNLWQQFEQGEQITFRYMTEAGEARQAVFSLAEMSSEMARLKK